MSLNWIIGESGSIAILFLWHLGLSVVPVIISLVLAIPLGWLAHRSGSMRPFWLGFAGLFYTIPSLALFVLLPLLLHTRILNPINVVVALTIYALAMLIRTVADGLSTVSPDTLQAATAMGYQPVSRFLAVELPLAVPAITAGLRVAVVSNVSIVSVAALIGTPQLGSLFTQGLQLRFVTPILTGIVLCGVLAVLLDLAVVWVGHCLSPWERSSK